MKDNKSILNDTVFNATCIIENHIEYLKLCYDQYELKNDTTRMKWYSTEITELESAISSIRERLGCY